MKINQISSCRICGNQNLIEILDLGDQALTGLFPKSKDESVPIGPLQLVKCHGEEGCQLVQLRHSFEAERMYGQNYGYRSGLNASMVAHLKSKAEMLQQMNPLKPGDVVLDIGSNDGTSLSFYPQECTRIGMDPTSAKFRKYYQPGIHALAEFFSAENFRRDFGAQKAKVISSIAMFYDLEDPLSFVRDIAEVLDNEGVWHFEQSYMPLMIERNAYDTVCHEHVEYYSLFQIQWMLSRCGLRILDVQFNDINGGSFAVTACKESSRHKASSGLVEQILDQEKRIGIHTLELFHKFRNSVEVHRDKLCNLIKDIRSKGGRIMGCGASTKGNVLLQYCGFTANEIEAVAEVNPDKFGSFTPGTLIPIISEAEARVIKPDYFLVLPWHFKSNLISREKGFLESGGKIIFPLPTIEIVEIVRPD